MAPKVASIALGFRVKSGWAAAVVLGGPPSAPTILEARRVELSDPETPATVQPYHAAAGEAQTNQRTVARLIRMIEQCTERSLTELLQLHRRSGTTVTGAGVVGTSATDPASIANPHIRAHALEGRLFRTVVEETLTRSGIKTRFLLEQGLHAEAVRTLKRSAPALKTELTAMGRLVSGPWRSDQKSAALAAWLVLAARR
jgi:hypothetical protein